MKTLNRALLTSSVAIMVWSGQAFACDGAALRANVEWLRTNNSGAYNNIREACGRMSDSTSIQRLINAYKEGQSHNPGAQAAIDGCTAPQLANFAC